MNIHELGSPARNIPSRAWLVPGVEAARAQFTALLEAAATAALDGNMRAMEQKLGEAGQAAVNSVTRRIQAGIPPPLKEATVARRRRRTPGSRYRRKATSAADVTPLIDTGNFLRSITFVVRDK